MTHKPLLILLALLLSLPKSATAEKFKVGTDMKEVVDAMTEAGYPITRLAMVPKERTNRIRFWGVDGGVLIIFYAKKTQEVISISYWFSDERPKMTAKTFNLEVQDFDTASGRMTIQTKKPNKGAVGLPIRYKPLKSKKKEKPQKDP